MILKSDEHCLGPIHAPAVSRGYSVYDEVALHQLPIETIDRSGLLRHKIRIAESFQAIAAGLYMMTVTMARIGNS
jgi:hypothetical protein